jgi:hypothetical protein
VVVNENLGAAIREICYFHKKLILHLEKPKLHCTKTGNVSRIGCLYLSIKSDVINCSWKYKTNCILILREYSCYFT